MSGAGSVPAVETLCVTSADWDRIVGHLRTALPHEGVGLLAVDSADGPTANVRRFYPGTNVDASPVRYTMAPSEVLAAFRDIESAGLRFGAIVHSHPATAPVPSDTDRRESYYPDVVLVIVGHLASDPVARAWRPISSEAGDVVGFAPIELSIRDGLGLSRGIGASRVSGAGVRMQEQAEATRLPEDQQLLRDLAAFPDWIRHLISGRSLSELREPASDGGWGVVDNLCHLRDWQRVFLERARRIVDEDDPVLEALDDSLWEIERNYRSDDPARALAEFAELRSEFVALLDRAEPAAWDRPGQHTLRGPLTLRTVGEHLREHDREHDRQLRNVVA